jgi:hypothetical protein
MNFKFFAFFLSTLLIISCSNFPEQNKPVANSTKTKSLPKNKPFSTFSDTLMINSTSAVFYYADSIQLEKIKLVTDSGFYEGSMHEYFSYMRNAHLVINKTMPQLKIIEAKNVRYILFINDDNSAKCIDLDTKADPYGLFFFKMKKAPQLVDMANIETELGFYF